MRVKFETGKRYRVRVKVPAFLSPKTALAMLKDSLSDVVLGEAHKGTLTAEATWKARPKTVDSEFLLTVETLETAK